MSETGPRLDYGNKEAVSPANFFDWRRSADTVMHLSALQWWDANLVERNNPERLQGCQVSWGFFDALGVRPAIGRGFVRDDETYGRHHVAIVSGRDAGTMEKWFGYLPITLVAEHGSSIKMRNESWQQLVTVSEQWKDEVRRIMQSGGSPARARHSMSKRS